MFAPVGLEQYGFGMGGQGTWAVLYATEFMYANGAQVMKDGNVGMVKCKGVRRTAPAPIRGRRRKGLAALRRRRFHSNHRQAGDSEEGE